MATGEYNIDADHDSAEDNPNISVNFSNVSCFGQMCDETPNDKEDIKTLRDSFKSLDLDGIDFNNIPKFDDIPLVTIKSEEKTEFNYLDWKTYQETQRIMRQQILDIHASTIISKKPLLYSFMGENYRFVMIVGTVMSKKSIKDDKANIGVDDGTGYISCIVDNSESELQCRKDLDNLIEVNAKKEGMSKEKTLKLAQLSSQEFRDAVKDKKDKSAFMITSTRMGLQHIKKQWEEFPGIEDLKIGENVVIVGAVSDFKDQRLIFVKHLKRDRNLSAYNLHMHTTIKEKNLILNS